MKEFKGTMDEIVQNGANGVHTKKGICVALTHGANCKVNALMIADAFKVRQQINCDLSELLEQRNEMLAMLKRVSVNYDKGTQTYLDMIQLIKKVKDNG
jgi:hypothetical protein